MLLISSTINTGYQRVPKIRVRNRRKALIYEDFSGMNMEFDSLIPCYKKTACLRGFFVPYCILVCCIIHISHNDLPEFHSTALSSIDDATASPHSAALQTENSFCVIMLKVNETVH